MKAIMRRLRRWFGRPEPITYDVPGFRYEQDRHPGWKFDGQWHKSSPSAHAERSA